MNHPTQRWSPMVSGPEDEFANFLDFGDLNFSAFDGIPQSDAELQQNGVGAMDTSMEDTAGMLGLEQGQMQHQMGQQNHSAPMNGFHGSTDSFPDLAMQSELFDQQQQQQLHMQNQRYHGQNVVPPTPNSMELHGGHAQYYRTPADHPQLHMYDHYRRQKDQMIFTPLVSPAVTPLDTQFQYPDYAAPTDAFSPLTSPALRAQNQNAAQYSVYGAVRGSDTSDTTSPIDHNLDYSAHNSTSTPASLRKSKRKTSSASTKNPARAVRQSPAMKPQRKGKPSSTVIPPKEISGIIEEARKPKPSAKAIQNAEGKLFLPYGQDSSGADSVSPEPLSDILMPPPATPKSSSASRSPYLNAKQKESQEVSMQDTNGEPATPASLMKIRKQAGKANGVHRQTSSLKEQTVLAEADMEQIMEDIVLPEPANTNKKPVLRPINTTDTNLDQSTPNMSARKTPRYGPASAPITAATSAFPSPQLGAMASHTGTGPGKRSDPKLRARDSKKRNSQGSVHVSPALRPKISPSIKPLLPEGGIVSSDASALLLASKSNYQNIIEGTHLPGVSYPETLSTNLTSKRTSHKIAEQGRRNRINTALQEIASLLPPSTPQVNGQGATNGAANENMMISGTAAQQSNSKASTVELAIEYIKSLQKELGEVKEKLEVVEKEKAAIAVAVEEKEVLSE
ncbi:hypothetical protein OEA41_000876 [Lepraria neglecta]|uniref:BHLH domain-containing protein n=1 Tax=Lepraria neglecta TaxID=209136 RepID=A0AAD9ZGH1_9LECA|nr:hypothetical protein OEA41_000876 [Lepraria neglecta]